MYKCFNIQQCNIVSEIKVVPYNVNVLYGVKFES